VALQELQHCDDTTTVSAARGLMIRVKDFEVILSIKVLMLIFTVTGPPSRILQSVASDLSISTHLIRDCITRLEEIRDDSGSTLHQPVDPEGSSADNSEAPLQEIVSENTSDSEVRDTSPSDPPVEKLSEWNKLLKNAESFASDNGIYPQLLPRRLKKTPRKPGEKAVDERPTDPNQLFKVEVFNFCLDTVITQLKSRFTDNMLSVFRQMAHFSHVSLMNEELIVITDIDELCAVYELDSAAVMREMEEFRSAYRSIHHFVSLDDMLPAQPVKSGNKEKLELDCSNVNGAESAASDNGCDTDNDEDDDDRNSDDDADSGDQSPAPAETIVSG